MTAAYYKRVQVYPSKDWPSLVDLTGSTNMTQAYTMMQSLFKRLQTDEALMGIEVHGLSEITVTALQRISPEEAMEMRKKEVVEFLKQGGKTGLTPEDVAGLIKELEKPPEKDGIYKPLKVGSPRTERRGYLSVPSQPGDHVPGY